MLDILAQVVAAAPEVANTAVQAAQTTTEVATGSFNASLLQGGLGCLGAAIGVGWVGSKSVEAIGRNPGSFSKVLILGILGMAFAEAIAFYALFLGK